MSFIRSLNFEETMSQPYVCGGYMAQNVSKAVGWRIRNMYMLTGWLIHGVTLADVDL